MNLAVTKEVAFGMTSPVLVFAAAMVTVMQTWGIFSQAANF